jgi:transposase
MDLLTMSKAELSRLEVMDQLVEGRIRQRTAAQVLGVSVRHVKRLLSAYRREGAAGLVSKQRGKASHHQLEAKTVQEVLDLLKKRYADFGPTLAHEKLIELDGQKISLGSVRTGMLCTRCGNGGHASGSWCKWMGQTMTGSRDTRRAAPCW